MPPLKLIIFRAGESYLALPSVNVKEILETDENIKPLFYGGELLKGIIGYEGRLVSVLDLPLLLNVPDNTDKPMVIICRNKDTGLTLGLRISDVEGIRRLNTSKLSNPSRDDKKFIKGFLKTGEDPGDVTAALIDLDMIAEYSYSMMKTNGTAIPDNEGKG